MMNNELQTGAGIFRSSPAVSSLVHHSSFIIHHLPFVPICGISSRHCQLKGESLAQPADEGLVRGINRWSLIAVAINGIIGAGIFGIPSKVFAQTGAYSLPAFIACAIVVVCIILCFAEV